MRVRQQNQECFPRSPRRREFQDRVVSSPLSQSLEETEDGHEGNRFDNEVARRGGHQSVLGAVMSQPA